MTRLDRQPTNERLHRAQRSSIAQARRRGRVEPAERAPEPAVDVRHRRVERSTESLEVSSGDLAEAGADDDGLGESPHFARQFHGLAALGQGSPALEQLSDGARDDRGEVRVQAGLKGGLDLPAPLAPAVTVHRGEALAEEPTHTRDSRALDIGTCVVLQHVLDVVGMAQQIHVVRAESHGDHVAVAAHAVREEAERIAARHGKDADERVAGGTRRRATCSGGRHERALRRPASCSGAAGTHSHSRRTSPPRLARPVPPASERTRARARPCPR